jgi:hypothetical protein
VTIGGSRSGIGDPASAGVLDLYRAGWAATVRFGGRQWVSATLTIGLLGAYVALRSLDADRNLLVAWVVVAGFITILSPAIGLIVLVGVAPFTEPFTISRQLGAKPLLVGILGAAVLIRYIAAGAWPRPPLPVVLTGGLALGTAAGVGVTLGRFGQGATIDAAQLWLAGIGGGMIVLAAAAWAARKGDLRPLVAAVATGTIAGLIGLLDFGIADVAGRAAHRPGIHRLRAARRGLPR